MEILFLIGAFCALPYIVYASIQTLRGQVRIGLVGTSLAYLGVIVPLAVLAVNTVMDDPLPVLTAAILADAVIVLVIGSVIVAIDFRRSRDQLNQSPGLLGVGVGVLLIIGIVITPLIMSTLSGSGAAVQAAADPVSGSFVIPSDLSGLNGTVPDANAANVQVNASQQVEEASDFAAVLEAETGLTSEAVVAQIQSGTTLAALIETNGGNLETVSAAMTTAFEQAIANGSIPQQMLQAFGGDVAGLVGQVMNGEVPGQVTSLVMSNLLALPVDTSGLPAGGLPGGSGDAAPSAGVVGAPFGNQQQDAATPNQEEITATPLATTPQPVQVELTPFVFPTVEAVNIDALVNATESPADVAENTPADLEGCYITVDFNLNLRLEPDADSEWVLTIPFGSVVSTTGPNEAGWWFVTYEDQSGWVSGNYVTPGYTCEGLSSLP